MHVYNIKTAASSNPGSVGEIFGHFMHVLLVHGFDGQRPVWGAYCVLAGPKKGRAGCDRGAEHAAVVQLDAGKRAVRMNHVRHQMHHGQSVFMDAVCTEKIEQLGIIAKIIPGVHPKVACVYNACAAACQRTKILHSCFCKIGITVFAAAEHVGPAVGRAGNAVFDAFAAHGNGRE